MTRSAVSGKCAHGCLQISEAVEAVFVAASGEESWQTGIGDTACGRHACLSQFLKKILTETSQVE